MAVGDLLLIGCGDGRIRALEQGEVGGEAPVVWTLEAPGVSDSITALAAGRVAPDAPVRIIAGSKGGFVFSAQTNDPRNPPQLIPGWPQQIEKGPIRCSIILRAPIRLGEEPRDLAVIASDGGLIDLRAMDGAASLTGWPHQLGDEPAGYPAVGDPDGDGVLEIAVTTRAEISSSGPSPG